MQQTLIALAALVAIANGGHVMPAVFGGFSYIRHTWCGPYGGPVGYMVDTMQECQHAAAVLHVPFASQAGQEWYAGCIVHNDHAYFVEYDADFESTRNHHQSSNKGFLCMNNDADDLGAFEMRSECKPGYKIQTEQECANAARAMSFERVGLAGSDDWEDGCIVNNREAYWVQPSGDVDHRPHQHNGGSICRMAPGMIAKDTNSADDSSDDVPEETAEEEPTPPITEAPATPVPATPVPATPVPPTPVPATPVPATPVPPTPVPATPVPPTPVPATPVPPTPVPPTPVPPTDVPVTPVPPTPVPPTPVPPTPVPPTPVPETPVPATPEPTSIFTVCHTKEYVYGSGVRWAKSDCNTFADKTIYSIDNAKHITRKKKNFCKSTSRFFKKCPRSCCYYKAQNYAPDYVKISKEDNKA